VLFDGEGEIRRRRSIGAAARRDLGMPREKLEQLTGYGLDVSRIRSLDCAINRVNRSPSKPRKATRQCVVVSITSWKRGGNSSRYWPRRFGERG
jgi:hypothetical protein